MSVTGKPTLGKNRKFYIDVDGAIATPTWTLAGKIQGLQLSGPHNVAEIEEREEEEVLVLLAHKKRTLSLQLTHRPGNTIYDAIQDAYENQTKIGVAIMSGPIANSGERGYQAEMYVEDFDDDQGHTNTAVAVTLRPAADYATAPTFVEIS